MTPWMDKQEIDLIKKYISPNDIMLEWGSGGSTVTFSPLVKKYFSIEHVEDWFTNVDLELNKLNLKDKVDNVLKIPDLPRTIPTKYKEFNSYIECVDGFNTKFDKVLIDGRGRQFCAAYILRFLNPNSIIFIHDFWVRSSYHKVFNWYEEVESIKNTVQTIVALKPKPNSVGLALSKEQIIKQTSNTTIPTSGLFNF